MNCNAKNRWDALAKKLPDIYKVKGQILDKAELRYLKKAYLDTERLWLSQLESMVPKVVLLSEAPLYGANKNYFYNPDTPPSAFFWFNDARAVAGEDFSQGKKFKNARKKKQFLINSANDSGLLILDLFPYAFNENTALNYRKVSKELYQRIFQDSVKEHLREKLDLIREKCSKSPLFLYRYDRIKVRINEYVASELCSKKLLVKNTAIASVGGTNMSLDRKSLEVQFQTYRANNLIRDSQQRKC